MPGSGAGRGAAPPVQVQADDRHRHAAVGREGRGDARSHRRLRGRADDGRRHAAIVCDRRRHAEGRGPRSAAAASGSAADVLRHRHPQRDRLSGDTEMTSLRCFAASPRQARPRSSGASARRAALLAVLLVPAALAVAQGAAGLDPADLLKPLADSWPSYSGDYTGRRYSALTQVNQANVKNLTLAWTARAHRRTGQRRRPARRPADRRPAAKATAASPSAARHRSRARSCRSTACCTSRRPTTSGRSMPTTARDLALLLEDQGRHAHRQSRRRDVGQLSVLRHAGRLLRVARRADRQGALAQGGRAVQPAVLLDVGADDDRQSRPGRHRQRSRFARLPAVVRSRRPASSSGGSTRCR